MKRCLFRPENRSSFFSRPFESRRENETEPFPLNMVFILGTAGMLELPSDKEERPQRCHHVATKVLYHTKRNRIRNDRSLKANVNEIH